MACSNSFLEALDLQLKCTLCKGIFVDPKTLSCLHNYCLGCIVNNQQVSVNNNQEFVCPECDTITAIPEGKFIELMAIY